jgi:hypothetical protein
MKSFRVDTLWDEQARVWCGHSDDIPVSTEAETASDLVDRVSLIAPELLELNGLMVEGESVKLVFHGGHEAERVVTAD